MYKRIGDLVIRDAKPGDAEILCSWWNDGKVMEHAGFPYGLNTSVDTVRNQIINNPESFRLLIIEIDGIPVGEMNYRDMGQHIAEIGIKICDFTKQGKGFGTQFLLMLLEYLFIESHFEKVVLDTNLSNTRAQHVYEKIGFRKVSVNMNSWKNQLGEWQSSVDYELTKDEFISVSPSAPAYTS